MDGDDTDNSDGRTVDNGVKGGTENSEATGETDSNLILPPTAPPIPQALTPEERRQIRERLREQQRASANYRTPALPTPPSSAPSSSEPAPTLSNNAPAVVSTESTAPPATESTAQPREDLIKTAVQFLSSSNVRSAPMSKKSAFLVSKGLTQEEIDIAVRRVSPSDVTPSLSTPAVSPSGANTVTAVAISNSSPQPTAVNQPYPYQPTATGTPYPPTPQSSPGYPPPPARPAFLQDPRLIPMAMAPPQPPKYQYTWKDFALVLILGGGSAAIIASVIKRQIGNAYQEFKQRYQEFLAKRRKMVAEYLESVVALCKSFNTKKDSIPDPEEKSDSENIISLPDTISSASQTITKSTALTAQLLKERNAQMKPVFGPLKPEDIPTTTTAAAAALESTKAMMNHPLVQLKESVNELTQYINQEFYMNPVVTSYYNIGFPGASTPTPTADDNSEAARWVRLVSEMKADIRSFKGMLLSRKNFPTPPLGSPGLPVKPLSSYLAAKQEKEDTTVKAAAPFGDSKVALEVSNELSVASKEGPELKIESVQVVEAPSEKGSSGTTDPEP
ncbi:peroxisomal membrane anchor protein conserved region-domain-containing protein [Cladochytrium replicatum]|nr:peroxisomal membrane anchor protein conserved region-domain-containing protein [Cladochytrium replicatum]